MNLIRLLTRFQFPVEWTFSPQVKPWVGRLTVLGGVTAFYLLLAGVLPAADDELYYWCWAQSLQPSYFDHPGMSAYLIRLATALFGDSLIAVRLPACLTSVFVLMVIARLSRTQRFVPLIALTPLFSFGAVLVTPDTPLLLFWSAYILWLTIIHEQLTPTEPRTSGSGESNTRGPSPGLWLLGGVILGCGALGKYTMALAVPAGFVSFVLMRGVSWRAWLPGYIGHGIVSAGIVTPILYFNYLHDFAPLKFQWEHANQAAAAGQGWRSFGEFVGVQVLLFGVLPIVLLPWAWANIRTLAVDPRMRVCVALYAVPMSIFLSKAMKGPLEGNWALVAFLSFWPLAAAWYGNRRSRLTRGWAVSTMLLPLGCTALLAAHLIVPLPFIEPHRDRITRQAERMNVSTQAADAVRLHGESLPIYTTSYQSVALLRYAGLDARQIAGATRPSNFTLTPERLEDVDRAYVFSEGPLPEEHAPGFGFPTIIANLPLVVRGETITCYQVLLYTKLPDSAP